MFIAEKWFESVVEVKRVSESIIAVKLVLNDLVVNVLSVYAPQVGRSEEEKDTFWDKAFQLVSSMPQNEMVIVAGDLNGYVGKNSDGYEGVYGGFRYGDRNTKGIRILEFDNAMDMILCNTMFKKEDTKLVTYESGDIKSAVD